MEYRKKALLHMAGTLLRMNQGIEKADAQEKTSWEPILAECQQTAVEIGTSLEAQGESFGVAVKILEDYCEELYQLSIRLDDREKRGQSCRKIHRQLLQVSQMMERDIPDDRKEVVFLPYNASMWDSLESVWMAARDDEGCDAYVIPIPYFEKNPDGSLGQLHDESDEYPDYVSVTDWREYPLEKRRPDAVYIHNPYDNWNHVTSVHPMFYSKELTRYTDMLVYIPYFITVNNQVPEHFLILPGTLLANRVIVESEEVRRQYISAFHKFEEENRCRGKFGSPEEKFLALGSPKLDRVRSVRREDVTILEEWRKIIWKEDGTRKKVVLYNTTIDSLLKNSQTVMDKIRDTLNIFRQNQDVALLWRPHPLTLSTIRSMRPNLYHEFCRIVEEYKKQGWGIYDDTADVERAIALSDAYYGDWSSVVTLYQAVGKPIMIQDYKRRGN